MKKEVLESLSSKDNGNESKILKSIRGCVECKDKMGNILFKKDNVITQTGKFFLLEKLLGIVGYGSNATGLKVNRFINVNNEQKPSYELSRQLVDRQLAVFAIGNGAITTSSTIGEAKAPMYSDVDLYKYLLFKEDNENYEDDGYFIYNPYVNNEEFLNKAKENGKVQLTTNSEFNFSIFKYIDKYLTVPMDEENGTFKLDCLNNAFKFVMKENEDDVHIEFSLTIKETDLDGYGENARKFNELGLFIVNLDNTSPEGATKPTNTGSGHTGGEIPGYENEGNKSISGKPVFGKPVENPELFSHITFNNMDLSSSQEVTFTYYIYIL